MEPPKKLGYRDLLRNLICENTVLSELFKSNKGYANLFHELKNYDVNDNNPLPLQKELLERMDVTQTQIMSGG